LKISEATGTPSNELHFPMEAFCIAIIFGEPPHGGNHAKRVRILKVRSSRPDTHKIHGAFFKEVNLIRPSLS